jgi:hypothetical protein
MAEESWDKKTERREYCAAHCVLSETARKSVPRWVYITTLTAAISISAVFGGWFWAALETVSSKVDRQLMEIESHVSEKLDHINYQYTSDVARFYSAVNDNKTLLKDLDREVKKTQTNQARIEVKQDLVLKKVKLYE